MKRKSNYNKIHHNRSMCVTCGIQVDQHEKITKNVLYVIAASILLLLHSPLESRQITHTYEYLRFFFVCLFTHKNRNCSVRLDPTDDENTARTHERVANNQKRRRTNARMSEKNQGHINFSPLFVVVPKHCVTIRQHKFFLLLHLHHLLLLILIYLLLYVGRP